MTTLERTEIPILDLRPQYESLKPEIHAAITRVLERGDFIMGEEVLLFEQEVAAYLSVKHAIGLNSGTDALFIGLRAMNIGAGDEVITTPFSFFATAEAISHVGATPVFVEIEERTFNINPDLIEAAITPRTKAIIPVHLYGRPCEMGKIMRIAQKHNLKVLEDCAQSFGAKYAGCSTCDSSCNSNYLHGRYTGSIGDAGAISFFPSKNLGAYGDGGMLVTNDDTIAEIARMLRSHGSKKKYHNEMVGYNSRLDTLQAAILRVKLPHVNVWNEARRQVAQTYTDLLEGNTRIVTPEVSDGHVFHQYTIRLTQSSRDAVQARLRSRGINTMVYYPIPQDRLPIYSDKHAINPVSDRVAREVLSLPIWSELLRKTQEHVTNELRDNLLSTTAV
jgi:dTDP-4-amino-4,6-dideoxygalactose transaminase